MPGLIYCNRGVLLQRAQEEWDAALVSYNRCLEINPGISYAYLNREIYSCEKSTGYGDSNQAIRADPANMPMPIATAASC